MDYKDVVMTLTLEGRGTYGLGQIEGKTTVQFLDDNNQNVSEDVWIIQLLEGGNKGKNILSSRCMVVPKEVWEQQMEMSRRIATAERVFDNLDTQLRGVLKRFDRILNDFSDVRVQDLPKTTASVLRYISTGKTELSQYLEHKARVPEFIVIGDDMA